MAGCIRVRQAIAIAILVFGAGAHAATIKSRDFKDGKVRLDLNGEIQGGDLQSVKDAIQAANAKGKMVVTIRLDSDGGNLLEAVRIAAVIREGKIATAALSRSTCASACFVIFAAGNEKYAHYTAQIGVHGASDQHGEETTRAQAATVTMARVVRELGVPAEIIGKMVVTPPSEMVWLAPDDLKSMGVTMIGKPEQLASPPLQLNSPNQLSSSQAPIAKQSSGPTWKSVIENAVTASMQQNGGRIQNNRVCQPELKLCTNAIFYKTNHGTDAMVRTTEDIDGKMVRRDLCTFNTFGDVRTCLDWDSGKVSREMRDANNKWSLIDVK